jgi:hypothetical protein
MARLLVAVAIVAVAAVVASIVRRRRSTDPPTQGGFELPVQLDRNDFDRAGAPWLVAVFTSSTCASCADVVSKAAVLSADDVAVVEVAYQHRPDLHARYAIDAVPALVLADTEGVVRAGFLGPVTATDLWAAVAAARG